MKKICGFFFLLCVALSVFIYAAEVKDGYLYGDLSIAYNNELPSGLFAKSRNYLPGDTLRITNPFTGEEISVLNLSSLDEDSDTVLMLTTEAANKLGIDVKNPLYVRISPRTNNFDEIAAGSAMLTYNKNSVPQMAEAEVASTPKAEAEPQQPAPVQEPPHSEALAETPVPQEPEPKQEIEPKVEPPQPEVQPLPPLPKEEPVADLSPLSEEPPVATVEKAEIQKVPEKMEEPVAEKPLASSTPDFAEETAVRSSDGKKTYTTVSTVSKTVLGTPADARDETTVEELAVKSRKEKPAPTKQKAPDVYEEQVLPPPVDTPAREIADRKEEPTYEEAAPLPSLGNKDSAPVAEAAPAASKSDAIPVITEESVKLASNGLKEVPSANLPVEEFSLEPFHTAASGNTAVYEYPQPIGGGRTKNGENPADGVQEIPVSYSPARNEAAASSMQAIELPVTAPKRKDPPPASPIVETAFKNPAEEPKDIIQPEPVVQDKEEEPVQEKEEKPLPPPVQNVRFAKDEPTPLPPDVESPKEDESRIVTDVPMTTEAPTVAESPTAIETPVKAELPSMTEGPKATEAPKLTESPKLTETIRKAEEPKKSDPPKVTEIPVRAETPKKAEATKKQEPPKKQETPKKVEEPKKKDSPKKAEAPKKTEPQAKAEPAKKQKPAEPVKKEAEAKKPEVKQEAKPVPVKSQRPVQEEQDADTELVYSQRDELMLIPSGGASQSYDGATQKPAADTRKAEDTDDSDIIVNKQDVLTLSPTDSISPDGHSNEGQKSYTPQKVEPKAKAPVSDGKTAGKAPAEQAKPAPKAAEKTPAPAPDSKTAGKAPAEQAKPAPKAAEKAAAPASKAPVVQMPGAIKEKDLKAGNYVQFATCTTDAEAEKILSKYKKYPIIKVLFETRPGYKLLVGPLNDDEKGAVLTRFKAFGYSDAYLRTIK